ncbi:uncharacterized protein A4U43_C08F14130 [Asparagus officinalis]|nr:uncharacterized protein A4U43_C08F14130 [Asparagus officinalis]
MDHVHKINSDTLKLLSSVSKVYSQGAMGFKYGAVQLLGSLGYDPNYGARPVKRVIQQNIENEIAKGILRGDFKDEDTILVDTELTAFLNGQLPQQKLVFRKGNSDASDRPAEDQKALSPST